MARPREFETEDALIDIMNVFWANGFEGTSMQDIEGSTGLNKQSLYRAFGDKRAMYLAALSAYEENHVAKAGRLLAQPGEAQRRFGRLLRHVVDSAVASGDRRGCFLCNASIDQAALDASTNAIVKGMMQRVENTFYRALIDSGWRGRDPALCRRMARSLLAGYFGLRVLIKAGLDAAILDDAVNEIVGALDRAT